MAIINQTQFDSLISMCVFDCVCACVWVCVCVTDLTHLFNQPKPQWQLINKNNAQHVIYPTKLPTRICA